MLPFFIASASFLVLVAAMRVVRHRAAVLARRSRPGPAAEATARGRRSGQRQGEASRAIAIKQANGSDAARNDARPLHRGGPSGQEPQSDRAQAVLGLVCGYLDEDDFSYRLVEESFSIKTGFQGHAAVFPIQIVVFGEPAALGVYVRLPLVVPDEQRTRVAETVVRANCGLLLGAFDYDISEGVLGLRCTMPVADATVTREQFQHLFYAALTLVDRYHRAFCRLLYGDDLSPAEVIAEVEMTD